MSEYKVSKVGFYSSETYGRNQNHRVMVNFEGHEKDYSAFVQEKPSVGDVWDGELKRVEKNDKIYWNFEFADKPRRDSSPASNNGATAELKNMLTFEVIRRLDKILAWQDRQDYIGEHGEAPADDYPAMTAKNDADFDAIEKGDIPF